jgi:hypothetical protein
MAVFNSFFFNKRKLILININANITSLQIGGRCKVGPDGIAKLKLVQLVTYGNPQF